MKKLLAILLLFTAFCNAQTFEFETIDKRTPDDWEIRPITGTVTITEKEITIKTAYNTQVLQVQNAHQFIRQNDKIFLCINEAEKGINLRLCSDYKDKSYCELYYYSDEPGQKYFRFCLKKI
ncbi:hypothetical protein [Flavobacterium sp.]|uniref:hypothetical protein n=1 Tax=Flavobacterium sp. TaxID=239 RepID=UPI00391AF6A2